MKNIVSIIACVIISIALLQYPAGYSDLKQGDPPLKVTFWDAFGYYAYLPAILKYHDYKELKWLTEIDKKYSVTGGDGWQAQKLDNGNYVFKYLGGVAIMEIPFYFIGDFVAKQAGYPPDGFSAPYQYALGFGVIFYCILSIFLLRRVLLAYFSDTTTAITLIMVCLSTNFIQYASIDNGQSHGYLFPLYVAVLYATMQWHKRPSAIWAIVMGYLIGLAMITRPTEAIIVLIPILWNTQNKISAKEKWAQVRQHKNHIILAGLFGLTGILPQLIYWKLATGSFVYDVGSKWEFLNPHFRVLFGWEKGWFIYTPVTVLFIVGMFYIKGFPFRKSVLWFCLLNIYIIIAWHDWRYGGSYSTRALVQSYPVFALPFAAFTEYAISKKWRIFFYLVCAYLLAVNVVQIYQYNRTILLYDGMNRAYYGRIYLNPRPTPLDMSLLDNDEVLNNETDFHKTILTNTTTTTALTIAAGAQGVLCIDSMNGDNSKWIKIESNIKAPGHLWQSFLNADLTRGDSVKHARVRLYSPISTDDKTNDYVFYMSVPPYFAQSTLTVYISSAFDFKGDVAHTTVTGLDK